MSWVITRGLRHFAGFELCSGRMEQNWVNDPRNAVRFERKPDAERTAVHPECEVTFIDFVTRPRAATDTPDIQRVREYIREAIKVKGGATAICRGARVGSVTLDRLAAGLGARTDTIEKLLAYFEPRNAA